MTTTATPPTRRPAGGLPDRTLVHGVLPRWVPFAIAAGSLAVAVRTSPPRARTSTSTVPSPPSPTGSSSASRSASRSPAATAAATLASAPFAHAGGNDVIKIGLVGCGGRGTGAASQALKADANVKLDATIDCKQIIRQ